MKLLFSKTAKLYQIFRTARNRPAGTALCRFRGNQSILSRTRDADSGAAEEIEKKSGIELFDEFYTLQNGQPLSAEQRAFAEEVLESLKEGTV